MGGLAGAFKWHFSDIQRFTRTQSGLNIAERILLPGTTVALAWLLVYFRVQYARTRRYIRKISGRIEFAYAANILDF